MAILALLASVPSAVAQPCFDPFHGVLGSGGDYPSVSGTQTGRLLRNGTASTCAVPKTCALFDSTPGRAFDAYTFTNDSGGTQCVTVELDVLTQAGCNLQANAYLGTYDPDNICTNYLADPGSSSGTPPSPTSYSFEVPDSTDFVVVVHTTNAGEIGCEYKLSVSPTCEVQDADLDLTKTVDADEVPPGGEVTYTLTVFNNGPDPSINAVLTDDLPDQFSWTADDCAAGPPLGGPPNGELTWNIGNLPSDSGATCNVTGTVSGPPGIVTNEATVTSDGADPDGASASVALLVLGVLAIPTLSAAGLVLLLLLLAGSAVWVFRRRTAG